MRVARVTAAACCAAAAAAARHGARHGGLRAASCDSPPKYEGKCFDEGGAYKHVTTLEFDFASCCKKCSQDADCAAYTERANTGVGGKCYFYKAAPGTHTASDRCDSGVVRSGPPAPPAPPAPGPPAPAPPAPAAGCGKVGGGEAAFSLRAHALQRGWAVRTNARGFEEVDLPLGPTNLTLITIPAGTFHMGSPAGKGDSNERPLHLVNLTEYHILKTPVTRGSFAAFEQATDYRTDMSRGLRGDCNGCFVYPSSDWVRYKKKLSPGQVPCNVDAGGKGCCDCDAWEPKKGATWNETSSGFADRDDLPVSCTSWNDGGAFGEWAAGELGLPHLVLPSEAQWMKAAQGASDDGRQYPWGDELPTGKHANFADASFVKEYGRARPCNEDVDDGWAGMAPVGSYPDGASPYGVLDMVGQGHEWAFDWMSDNYYKKSESCNPLGPSPTSKKPPRGADGKVNLGGAWNSEWGCTKKGKCEGGDNIRVRSRQGDEPDSADDHSTFRVVLDPSRPAATIGLRATEC